MLTLPLNAAMYTSLLHEKQNELHRKKIPFYTSRFKNVWGDDFGNETAEREIRFANGYGNRFSFVAAVTLSETDEEYILHLGKMRDIHFGWSL